MQAIKALIIEAYEKLATSAQPLMEQHWDAMYTSILEALAQNRTELAVPAFYSLSKIIDSNSEVRLVASRLTDTHVF